MIFTWLLLLVPLSLALHYFFHAGPLATFICAVLAIVPLAEWIRRATEQLAHRAGSAIGGLLNVTFGNTPELVLALFVLRAGETTVVKGQITGSIIGNSLLGLGLAIVVGSWGRARQCFKRERGGMISSMLILVMIALLVPALFDYTERGLLSAPEVAKLDERLSLGVAVVLIAVYFANLLYTLVTHRDIFAFEEPETKAAQTAWPIWQSLGILFAGTIATAWEAELVSSALAPTATQLGISAFFLGVFVLAVVGNAAEYVAAIYFARRDQMGLVISITVGSTIQVALLVAPVLVIVSHFMGHPMNLVFDNPLELIAIAAVSFAVNAIAEDGETTWFEGVLLLAVYLVLGMAFFFVTK
ncbi:MAG: calcium/proton exchanger [Chthoniobacterales bacterium]|nr:calcium/proton exchanger [Chthoniobacterales bacterium]